MADFDLVEGGIEEGGPGCLFHTPAFFRLHAQGGGRYYEWVRKGRAVACVHFTRTEGELWRSPARGTFAGYAFQRELRLEDFFAFHDAAMARLAADGARHFEILPAPMAHDPAAFANQVYLLHARGFQVTQCDLNQSLEVTAEPLADRMRYGEVKRLRKCLREGLIAQQLPPSALAAVYETLAANRAGKGRAMSMSLEQLQTMVDVFPGTVQLFGSRDGDTLAAAALCLRLSERVLYVVFWGGRPRYATLSPVVAVAEAIYAHCQACGIGLLDVGTSTVDTEPDFGLVQFKRGLGFTESLKLRLRASL